MDTPRKSTPLLLLVPWVLGLASAAPSTTPTDLPISQIAREYAGYRLITPRPVRVHPEQSEMCAYFVPSEQERHVVGQFGPHAHTALKIFMNDRAADAFAAKAGKYPVGAVVIKQKTFLDDRGDEVHRLDGGQEVLGAVGGMVKRPPGYDAEHGDWEYFYFDRPTEIASGHLESCVTCHAAAKAKDHVFGDWGAQAR
jgi:hypothetical protein